MWTRTTQIRIWSQRRLLTTSKSSNSSSSSSWRKEQLDRLLKRNQLVEPAQTIQSDEDLQPMWQAMERRVKNRPPPRKEGKGRTNIKKTDEDIWFEQGLYAHLEVDDDDDSKSK